MFDSQADTTRQLQGIQDFISRKAKVLIVCELYSNDIEKALLEASAQGIAIIFTDASHDATVPGAVSFIDQNVELGLLAGTYTGQYITDHMGGTAHVAILDYPDLLSITQRANAIANAVCRIAPGACPKDASGRTIPLPRFKGATPDFGATSTVDMLKKAPDVNLIVSINDAGAMGAIQTLKKAGKTPADVAIIGIDGDPSTLQDMKDPNGWFQGTVQIDTDAEVTMLFGATVKTLNGTPFPHSLKVSLNVITRDSLMATVTAQPTLAVTP